MSAARFISAVTAVIVVCAMVGAALAWWRTGVSPGKDQMIRNGGWWTSLTTGGSAQTPELRAYVARTGILALAQSEVIYFQTAVDSSNQPLSTACDYEVSGRDLDTQWWSVTAYDRTNRFFQIRKVPASFNSRNLGADSQGVWRFQIGVTPRDGDWIPILNTGGMNLLLRLYRPSDQLRTNLNTAPLPTIRRLRCA